MHKLLNLGYSPTLRCSLTTFAKSLHCTFVNSYSYLQFWSFFRLSNFNPRYANLPHPYHRYARTHFFQNIDVTFRTMYANAASISFGAKCLILLKLYQSYIRPIMYIFIHNKCHISDIKNLRANRVGNATLRCLGVVQHSLVECIKL